MSNSGFVIGMARTLLLGIVLPVMGGVVSHMFLTNWKWTHIPFHSFVESFGVFAAVILARLLLVLRKHEKDVPHYLWISCALIAIGILDGFHSSVQPGLAFVWFRFMATLIGGVLFAMVWLPEQTAQGRQASTIVGGVTVGTLSICVLSLAFPDMLPAMLSQDGFTPLAGALNMVGGFCYLLAAVHFLVRYHTGRQSNELTFAALCLFFGSAALLTDYSVVWGADWWFWHLLRVIAYLVALGFMFKNFKSAEELKSSNESLELANKSMEEVNDALGFANRSLERAMEGLRTQNKEILEAVNVLASSAAEISSTVSQIASGAAQTASAVSETSTTVEEVKQTTRVASEKAKYVSETAQSTMQVSQTGEKAVEEAKDAMHRIREQMESIAESIIQLSEQTQAISEIIGTVDELAGQSNLLAVNAAIEAAKAGEYGKGFGVVAQEIKILAEQSKQATGQVRAILNDIQKATSAAVMVTEQGSKAVEAGVKKSALAGESIIVLAKSIAEAANAAVQIAMSNQQQFVGIEQVSAAMESINLASSQNVESTRQLQTEARRLHELGQSLKNIVENFKIELKASGSELEARTP